MQLFWTSYWPFSHYYAWPWIVITCYCLPLIVTTAYVQSIDMEETCHQQQIAAYCPNGRMPLYMLVANPMYIFFVLYTLSLVTAGFFYRPVGAYVIMFENTTYFFNSMAAFFWVGVPIYLCFVGEVPFKYDAASGDLPRLYRGQG